MVISSVTNADLITMDTTSSNHATRTRRLVLPEDLRLWVPESQLMALTLECVAEFGLPAQGMRIFDAGQATYSAPMLCTLLTFAYATGRLAAQEIQDEAQVESCALRYLCANQFPDWHTLRRFRRGHRSVISACLAQVFLAATRERSGTGPWMEVLRDAVFLKAQCAAAAEDRIRRAILADTVSLDI